MFDGVRGVCTIAVLLGHLAGGHLWARRGEFGVDVFFILSGFLITTQLLEEHSGRGRIDLRAFYRRRVARVFPTLLVALAVLVPIGLAVWPDQARQAAVAVTAILAYSANWVMVATRKTLWIFPHAWSLSVEEQFYVLWPPILVLLLRRSTFPPSPWRFLWGGILFGMAWRTLVVLAGATAEHAFFGSDCRIDQILMGCLIAVGRHHLLLPDWIRARTLIIRTAVVAIMAFVGIVVWPHHRTMWIAGRPLWSAAMTLGLLTLVETEVPYRGVLLWRPLVALGKISYGVYVWHLAVLLIVKQFVGESEWTRAIVTLAITLLASVASYRWVEQPILRAVRERQRNGSTVQVA